MKTQLLVLKFDALEKELYLIVCWCHSLYVDKSEIDSEMQLFA